jgi:hypothetical protein
MAFDTYALGPIWIAGAVLMGVLGLVLSRRIFTSGFRLPHDVASALLSVVGTLYAVLLGLIVVDSITNFEEARMVTEHEAIALGDLILFSRSLPPPLHAEITQLADEYVDHVVKLEWPAMETGRFAPEARSTAIRIADAVARFEPKTSREEGLHDLLLQSVQELWNNRRLRLTTATHHVPTLQWIVVVAGAIVTILFTYSFEVAKIRLQVVMTALVTLIIALNIYMLMMFGEPFSGDLKVRPDTFARQVAAARATLTDFPDAAR